MAAYRTTLSSWNHAPLLQPVIRYLRPSRRPDAPIEMLLARPRDGKARGCPPDAPDRLDHLGQGDTAKARPSEDGHDGGASFQRASSRLRGEVGSTGDEGRTVAGISHLNARHVDTATHAPRSIEATPHVESRADLNDLGMAGSEGRRGNGHDAATSHDVDASGCERINASDPRGLARSPFPYGLWECERPRWLGEPCRPL